jgi:hypothetical protein
MMPGETALTRMPRVAYSIASDLVADCRPPLVSAAQRRRNLGVGVIDQAGGHVHNVAAAVDEHLLDGELGNAEEAGQVHSDRGGVVVLRVVSERLGHEDARVVDQGVDPAELRDARRDHALGGGRVGDVALDGEDARVAGGGNGARGGDDGVAQLPVGVHDAGADALRGTGDDCDLLVLSVHDDLFREDEYLARSVTSRPVNYLLRTLSRPPAEVNGWRGPRRDALAHS